MLSWFLSLVRGFGWGEQARAESGQRELFGLRHFDEPRFNVSRDHHVKPEAVASAGVGFGVVHKVSHREACLALDCFFFGSGLSSEMLTTLAGASAPASSNLPISMAVRVFLSA